MNAERGWGWWGGERSHVGEFFIEVGLKHEFKRADSIQWFFNWVHVCAYRVVVVVVWGEGCKEDIWCGIGVCPTHEPSIFHMMTQLCKHLITGCLLAKEGDQSGGDQDEWSVSQLQGVKREETWTRSDSDWHDEGETDRSGVKHIFLTPFDSLHLKVAHSSRP